MIVRSYGDLNTLELFRCYASAWEEYEDVVTTKKKRFYTRARFHKWKEQKCAELDLRLDALEVEVAKRYERVVELMCRRVDGVDEQQYGTIIKAVWAVIRDRWAEEMASMPRDHREFPRWFWRACERNVPGNISSLKGKFMLRPFIDELPGEAERNALLSRAYHMPTQPSTGKQEFELLLESACDLLHQQLLERGADVSVLTDDMLTPEVLEDIASPLEFYAQLLFPRAGVVGKGV